MILFLQLNDTENFTTLLLFQKMLYGERRSVLIYNTFTSKNPAERQQQNFDMPNHLESFLF